MPRSQGRPDNSSSSGRDMFHQRHSVVITDADFLVEAAGRLMGSISEAAISPGFLSLLGREQQPGGLSANVEALSLESRTVWCRGRLSRSLIFEVTTREEQQRPPPLADCRAPGGQLGASEGGGGDAGTLDEEGDDCRGGGLEVVGDLLAEVVDDAVETVRLAHRDGAVVRSLLASSIPEALLDHRGIQEMSSCLEATHFSLVSSAQRMQAAWRIILVSTAAQLVTSFRRILTQQNERLAAELSGSVVDGGGGPRDLLTEPRHGLLALLEERRRLLLGQSVPGSSSSGGVGHTTNDTAIPAIAFDDSSVVKVCSNGSTHRRRRCVSDPGPGAAARADNDGSKSLSQEERDPLSAEDALLFRRVARETLLELRQVSDRILELCVAYLKSATSNVIDSSVEDVKALLVGTRL